MTQTVGEDMETGLFHVRAHGVTSVRPAARRAGAMVQRRHT
jgi:hypothetical protein